MRLIRNGSLVAGAVWLVFVATALAGAARAATPLTAAEEAAYARWLGVAVAAAPDDSTVAPGTPLFPSQLTLGTTGPSLLASGRITLSLEAEAAHPPRKARPVTIGDALTAARAYRALGEYDKALGWYADAAMRDDEHRFAADITREALAAAAALGDSQRVVRHLDAALALTDAPARLEALTLAYRYLLARNDTTALLSLERRLDAAVSPLPPTLIYWRALAAAWRGDWEPALAGARTLLTAPDSALSLGRRARLWVAGSLPDLLLLTGQRADAAALYRQLAAGGTDDLSAWSRYQLASLDLLAGHFGSAGAVLGALCAATDPWPWRGRACSLAAMADTLARLSGEGGDRGTVAVAGR